MTVEILTDEDKERALSFGIDLDAILGAKLTAAPQTTTAPDHAVRITDETMRLYGFKSAKGLGKRFAAMGKRQDKSYKVRTCQDGPQGAGIYVWTVEPESVEDALG